MSSETRLTPEQYDEMMARLNIEKSMALDEALKSGDSREILKAQQYLVQQKKASQQGSMRAFTFDPYNAQFSGQGYKREQKKVSFATLKRMGGLHVTKLVKNTRINQVKNFLKFTLDENEEGFTIRRKVGLFDTSTKNISRDDKKEIERIVKYLENSKIYQGIDKNSAIKFDSSKWDIYDDFDEFISSILDDSLTYDQLTFETQRNRKFELIAHKAIDASTIRLLDTIDPRFAQDNRKQYDEVMGYLPRYCQIWGTEIQQNPFTNQDIVYYPWELAFAVRNKNTDILKNGYGESELEILLNIVTWILYSFEYNGSIFKNGANPKGIMNIKNGGGGQDVINDFREAWRHMVGGPNNMHKIPVFEGIDLEWIDLQLKNNDMEFQGWLEFLIVMFCAVYTIDPSELGFEFKSASKIFGQDGQKQRLEHSRDKGLKPLLEFLQKVISKYIVTELNPDFEFIFTGISVEDEEQKIKNVAAALTAGITSFEKQFENYEGEKYDEKKHTILNPIFQQAQQMKMYGNPGANEEQDQMNPGSEDQGAQNPFDEFAQAEESNPIIKASMNYLRGEFNMNK